MPVSRRRRIVSWILLAIIVIPIGLLLISSRVRHVQDRRDSLKQLKVVRTGEDAAAAVGYLGVVLRPDAENGGWIAVRYRDSHSLPGYSFAIVRCSDGSWFESSKHFCGRFANFRNFRKQRDDWIAGAKTDEERRDVEELLNQDPELAAIDRAESLQEAKEMLERIGFAPIDPP